MHIAQGVINESSRTFWSADKGLHNQNILIYLTLCYMLARMRTPCYQLRSNDIIRLSQIVASFQIDN